MKNLKNFTAAHLPVCAAPSRASWHAFGMQAAVAGAANGIAVLTRGTGYTGAGVKTTDAKRTTSRMVDPAPSSPPV